MNFEFSAESEELRAHARRFLDVESPPAAARRVLEGRINYDWELWGKICDLGWRGVSIPEEYGGSGLPVESLCVLAEELGAKVNSTAFSSSVYLASTALLLSGTSRQKDVYLRELIAGTAVACVGWSEGLGDLELDHLGCRVSDDGRLTGSKYPVLDGLVADLGLVWALDSKGRAAFYIVDLSADGVERHALSSIDPSRNVAHIQFSAVKAERLGDGDADLLLQRLFDHAAVLFAFEQIGGAATCLRMACDYANERRSFGRKIGSYQAIKHSLARVFVALELARSNAYYATMALEQDGVDRSAAACAARVSASEAYELAATTVLQVHGGMGFTWESDCHLHLRRAKLLSLCLGSTGWWRERLADCLTKEHGEEHGL